VSPAEVKSAVDRDRLHIIAELPHEREHRCFRGTPRREIFPSGSGSILFSLSAVAYSPQMSSPSLARYRPLFTVALLTTAICAVVLHPASTLGAPFVVPKAALQPPQVTFSEVPNGTAINGLTINGFTFSESNQFNVNVLFTRPNSPFFPTGGTNNITGDKASTTAALASNYVLTVNLASPATAFGFGFASGSGTVLVTLFNGTTNLGSLAFASAPDPTFFGGFAGHRGHHRFHFRPDCA